MAKDSKPVSKRLHHHLISAQIIFMVPGSEMPSAVPVNAVLQTESTTIAVHDIGQAQKTAQMVFHRMMDADEPSHIVNCVITGLMYLGHMTDEEFKRAPAGLQIVPKTSANDVPDPFKDAVKAVAPEPTKEA